VHVTRALALLICCVPWLSACGTTYLLQAARGQAQLMSRRQPIARVIADPARPEALRSQLETVRAARQFASRELALPDNRSYTTYADIGRPFAVWSVVATPEFSIAPRTWCFPVAGCVAYRGYFREAAAQKYAATLQRQGYDVTVGGVTAYSTLGKFADPVVSSMLRYGDLDVVATLFHELSHQLVYVRGDTAFNEAFAVTVEGEGVRRWLHSLGRDVELERYRARRARQAEFAALVARTRGALAGAYSGGGDPAAMRAAKRRILGGLVVELRALQARYGQRAGFDAWLGQGLNNAQLASVATYWQCVPGFERVLAAEGGDLVRFYARVREMARRPGAERRRVCEAPPEPAPARQ
jgi:predicted aminopeptidase